MALILPALTRRALLAKTGTLSVAGFAVLAGLGTRAFAADAVMPNVTMPAAAPAAPMPPMPSRDLDILNIALGLEHQGIAAYQIGIDSGLLQQPALNVALLFQSHHKVHRDTLIAAIRNLGGTPVTADTQNDYAKSLNAAALKSQGDILELATKLELGATDAYIGVIPNFADHSLAKLAARLVADEAMHWTALLAVQQKPLPAQALTFGV
jgi:hypothetical protein